MNIPLTLQKELSIFHQEWWLNICSHQKVSYIEVKMGDNQVSLFPFLQKKSFGLSTIKMPKYTRTLGPVFFLPPSKTFRREQNIRHVVEKIVTQLPKYHGIRFILDPENESAFAFKLAGFKINQNFTFRIKTEKSLEDVWQDCDLKTRNLIRTADKKLTCLEENTCENFITLSRSEVQHNHHDFPTLRTLFDEAHKRKQAVALCAYDNDQLVSSALLIWDHTTLYYWQSVQASRSKIAGKNMLLIWKAIEIAKKYHLTFDFDGFGSARTAKMLASFGQKPVVRSEVVSQTPLYTIERTLNSFIKKYITKKSYKYDF